MWVGETNTKMKKIWENQSVLTALLFFFCYSLGEGTAGQTCNTNWGLRVSRKYQKKKKIDFFFPEKELNGNQMRPDQNRAGDSSQISSAGTQQGTTEQFSVSYRWIEK